MKQKNDMVGLIIKGVYYTAAYVTSSLAFGLFPKIGMILQRFYEEQSRKRECKALKEKKVSK